jgi:hypothetical protein
MIVPGGLWGQRPAERAQTSLAGSTIQKIPIGPSGPQERYNKIDARHDAELIALQRLTPWLSKEEAQRLRPAFHIWCEVVRQGLSSPQIADSSFGFNMNLYHALKATLPLQDGPLMFELFRGIARALDVADRAVPECCQRKGVCAFSVVRRQLGMDDEHPEVTGNTGAGRGGNQSY